MTADAAGVFERPPGAASVEACDITIWEDYFRMPCGYLIVNDRCVRHGKKVRTPSANDSLL